MPEQKKAEAPQDPADALLSLARAHFHDDKPPITPAEERFFRATTAGEVAKYGPWSDDFPKAHSTFDQLLELRRHRRELKDRLRKSEEGDAADTPKAKTIQREIDEHQKKWDPKIGAVDPEHADEWKKSRVLRGDRLVWLCSDRHAQEHVTHRGVQVVGARIDGHVDLHYAEVPFPLLLFNSAVQGRLNLTSACLRALHLTGTHTRGIGAHGVKMAGYVFLRNGFIADGEVGLVGATIGGNLDCSGGQFRNPDGPALNAERLRVEGQVNLCDGFVAEGEVRLLGATLGRDLVCAGGQFRNPGGHALGADGMKVEGAVFLRNGFAAEGEVRLLGATVGGNLECYRGQFRNPGGRALNADGIRVGGCAYFRDGFTAEGEVRLVGATICGVIDCAGGQFRNRGGYALEADGLKVEGNVFLRDGFAAEGTVSLAAAQLALHFQWWGVREAEKATLDLRSAHVGTLWDEEMSWPPEGKLDLHGFTYDEITHEAPLDAKRRIEWLRLQEDYWTQPYEQLAEVLRKQGMEERAKAVQVAKNDDRLKTLKRWGLPWWWLKFLGVTIGYGHQLRRSLWWLGGFWALGTVLFMAGYWGGALQPVPGQGYEPFCPVVYSLDLFVQVVDLWQANAWWPDAALGFWGQALRGYAWFHIVMGWVWTTMALVGLTGVAKK